jgi:hypothetical protein
MSVFDPTVRYVGLIEWPGYLVGDDGSVWSCKHRRGWLTDEWRRVAVSVNQKGYHFATFCTKRKRTTFSVARLVLMAFVGPRPEGMEACHKDDNRSNNVPSNLEWDTHANNVRQRNERGRQAFGERSGAAKLKASDVPNIFILSALGFSRRTIAPWFGVSYGPIDNILARKTWKHLHSHATHPRRSKKADCSTK